MFFQKAYAALEEKDWMLINEDKRPNLITNQDESHKPEAVPAAASKPFASNNDEFQLICFAKSGIGLSLVSREPPEEILYLFMANVVIDYQVRLALRLLRGKVPALPLWIFHSTLICSP